MVCSGEERRERAMNSEGREKQQPPLYSFNQPFLLKWGNQRQVRAIKLPPFSFTNNSSSSSSREGFSLSGPDRNNYRHQDGVGGSGLIKNHRSSTPCNGVRVQDFRQEFDVPRRRVVAAASDVVAGEEEEGIDAVREKLVFDLRKEADKMKQMIFETKASDEEAAEEERFPTRPPMATQVGQEVVRPWNLRTRRTAGKVVSSVPVTASEESPAVNEGLKPSRGRGERVKFSVGLKRKEIEDDFMALVGNRPARRLKKRPRAVQKDLDVSFGDG